jgi:septum site-determining protein MinD
MAKTILITSGKGGVGKSTVCTMLGSALARQGSRVLMLETDCGLRNLDLMNGLENQVVYDLGDVLLGRCEPAKAILKCPNCEGLDLLPAAGSTRFQIPAGTLSRLISGLRDYYDTILIDCPAGFDDIFDAVMDVSDMGLVVVTPNMISVKDGAKAADLLVQGGVKEGRLLINMVPNKWKPTDALPDFDAIIDMVGMQLIGVIPMDAEMSENLNRGRQVGLYSEGVEVFDYIARRLRGKWVPLRID